MKGSRTTLLLCLIVALLLLLVWATVTGRLGRSRHGYAAAATRDSTTAAPKP